MELILYKKDFERIKEKSKYNRNWYKCVSKNPILFTEIYEHCDENYDTYEFFLKEGDSLTFLGSSRESLAFDKKVNIDFRVIYT